MNNMQGFGAQKQQAINQINEMKKRATKTKEKFDTNKKSIKASPNFNKKQPVLGNFSLTDDTLIILGLIYILSSENNDMLLLLALAYILM